MLMGLTIKAPPPVLSPDLIQPFNALEAMSENVFTDLDEKTHQTANDANEHDGWSPSIPTTTTPAPSVAWLPAARMNSSTDAAAQWEAVSTAWQAPTLGATNVAKTALSAWQAAFGWAPLKVAAPSRCAQASEMELDYLAAPMLTAAS